MPSEKKRQLGLPSGKAIELPYTIPYEDSKAYAIEHGLATEEDFVEQPLAKPGYYHTWEPQETGMPTEADMGGVPVRFNPGRTTPTLGEVEQMGVGEKFLRGMGGRAELSSMGIAQGIGAPFGGSVFPNEQTITEKERTLAPVENTFPGKMGGYIGAAAPYLLAPTPLKFIPNILTNAALGYAFSPVGEQGSRGQNAITSGIGAGIGYGVGSIWNKIVDSLTKRGTNIDAGLKINEAVGSPTDVVTKINEPGRTQIEERINDIYNYLEENGDTLEYLPSGVVTRLVEEAKKLEQALKTGDYSNVRSPTITGAYPTTAEVVKDPGLAKLQNTLQQQETIQPNAITERLANNDAARIASMRSKTHPNLIVGPWGQNPELRTPQLFDYILKNTVDPVRDLQGRPSFKVKKFLSIMEDPENLIKRASRNQGEGKNIPEYLVNDPWSSSLLGKITDELNTTYNIGKQGSLPIPKENPLLNAIYAAAPHVLPSKLSLGLNILSATRGNKNLQAVPGLIEAVVNPNVGSKTMKRAMEFTKKRNARRQLSLPAISTLGAKTAQEEYENKRLPVIFQE